MALSLSQLKSKGTKKRKRVGRGNASGHGTYSTRGLKGQKSRSGVSGLKRLGMKKQLLAVPKRRGFRSYHAPAQAVTLEALNKAFKDKATISPKTLAKAGLTRLAAGPVKILSRGELKLKGLVFEHLRLSASAREKVEKAGGSIKS